MKLLLATCLALAVTPVFGDCECRDKRILDEYIRGICLDAITDVTSNCKEDIIKELDEIRDDTEQLIKMNMEMMERLEGLSRVR